MLSKNVESVDISIRHFFMRIGFRMVLRERRIPFKKDVIRGRLPAVEQSQITFQMFWANCIKFYR